MNELIIVKIITLKGDDCLIECTFWESQDGHYIFWGEDKKICAIFMQENISGLIILERGIGGGEE